jgi:hypothetical protein
MEKVAEKTILAAKKMAKPMHGDDFTRNSLAEARRDDVADPKWDVAKDFEGVWRADRWAAADQVWVDSGGVRNSVGAVHRDSGAALQPDEAGLDLVVADKVVLAEGDSVEEIGDRQWLTVVARAAVRGTRWDEATTIVADLNLPADLRGTIGP